MYQVEGQLHITKRKQCYFVVYTKKFEEWESKKMMTFGQIYGTIIRKNLSGRFVT
jgi:hypothetical protein